MMIYDILFFNNNILVLWKSIGLAKDCIIHIEKIALDSIIRLDT